MVLITNSAFGVFYLTYSLYLSSNVIHVCIKSLALLGDDTQSASHCLIWFYKRIQKSQERFEKQS